MLQSDEIKVTTEGGGCDLLSRESMFTLEFAIFKFLADKSFAEGTLPRDEQSHATINVPRSHLRYSYRPGVGVLRLLEGHGDKRHVGAELHVPHRRQAIQRMLRKFSEKLHS